MTLSNNEIIPARPRPHHVALSADKVRGIDGSEAP
jgi:hypothetical protein